MEQESGGILRSTVFWQGWSLAATVAAVFAFAANVEYSVNGHAPDYVAIFGDAGTEPMWVVNADLEDGLINVRAGSASAPGEDEVYRLWVARQDDPQEIGVLPVNRGRETYPVSRAVRAVLAHGQTLGVSLGPASTEDDESTPTSFAFSATITRL
ncbi:MAG: hypothetical protein OXL38_06125 [Gammaproteobacteria bacterium]|nr:hypothetical protein [Gammaproteobacteria bacterium]